jgi:hypothetical protein
MKLKSYFLPVNPRAPGNCERSGQECVRKRRPQIKWAVTPAAYLDQDADGCCGSSKISPAYILNDGEAFAVGEIHRKRHDVAEFAANFRQHAVRVLDALLDLGCDVASPDDLTIGIPCNLTGYVQHPTIAGHDALRKRAAVRTPHALWIEPDRHTPFRWYSGERTVSPLILIHRSIDDAVS